MNFKGGNNKFSKFRKFNWEEIIKPFIIDIRGKGFVWVLVFFSPYVVDWYICISTMVLLPIIKQAGTQGFRAGCIVETETKSVFMDVMVYEESLLFHSREQC